MIKQELDFTDINNSFIDTNIVYFNKVDVRWIGPVVRMEAVTDGTTLVCTCARP